MKIEELDVDEHFDISVLSVIQNDIVVHMGQPRVPLEVIEKLVSVIRESSRLYYIEDTNDRSSDIAGTTGTIVPVMKESFAYASFMTLFSLCSCEKQGKQALKDNLKRAIDSTGYIVYRLPRGAQENSASRDSRVTRAM